MSVSISSIRAAMQAHLKLTPGYLGDANTQWENTLLAPTEGQPYQRVNFLFADPINPEMGGYAIENGFMQITLMYPLTKGAGDAMTYAQSIRDFFNKGLPLTASGANVVINRTPTIAPGAIDGDRYSVPVKIRFYASNVS